MRSVDLTEEFQEGLKPVATANIRWAVVEDVFPEGLTVQGPDGIPIRLAPPRSIAISWMDNPGVRSFVRVVGPWGSSSVPPKGSHVVVSETDQGDSVVLGFAAAGSTSAEEERTLRGDYGDLETGEAVRFLRAYRLRTLSNYSDSYNIDPTGADFETDLILGYSAHSLVAEHEDIRIEAAASVRTSIDILDRNIEAFIQDVEHAQVDDATKKALIRDLQMFTLRHLKSQMLSALVSYLSVEVPGYFTGLLNVVAQAGLVEGFQLDMNAFFSQTFIPLVTSQLIGRLRYKFPSLDPGYRLTLEGNIRVSADQLVAHIRSRTGAYLRRKFEVYISSKVAEGLRGVLDSTIRRGLRAFKNEVLSKLQAKLSVDFPFEGLGAIGKATERILQFRDTILRELREGLRDPEPVKLLDWTFRSRRDEENYGEVRITVESNGAVMIDSNRGQAVFHIDETGQLELKAEALVFTSEEVRLGSHDAGKQVALDGDVIHGRDWLVKFLASHVHPVGPIVSGPPADGALVQINEGLRGIGSVDASAEKVKAE